MSDTKTWGDFTVKYGEANAKTAQGMKLKGYRYVCFTKDKLTGKEDVFYTKSAEQVGPVMRELYPDSAMESVDLEKINW